MHPALETLPAWADPWPGKAIIDNLPEDQYHGTKALVSKSALDVFARTPAEYEYSLDSPPEEQTEAMLIGHAFHVLTLEPDLYNRKVCVMPEFGDMRSSTNRAVRDAFIRDEARGRACIKQLQHDKIAAMAQSVRKHPAARKLLREGQSEVTALWTDPETGLRCKSRADWLSSMRGIFADLKSALSASPHEFARAAAANRYHVQDTFYSRAFEENGIHIEHFVFIVVEKEPPYLTAVYQLDTTAKLKGEELYMSELRQMRDCRESGVWPGYSNHVVELALPAWSTRTEST